MENDFGIAGLANIRHLAEGGNATVYLAEQPHLDRTVALKVINRGEDEATLRRFKRERTAMGRLSDVRGIAPVYDSGTTDDDRQYLIMPYYREGSLWDLIKREGRLEAEQVRQIGITVAKALHVAHEHDVIHRDLKPANVLIDNEGVPQIADFGIAQLSDSDGGTSLTLTITALYSAPEIISGHDSSALSDVYSLGATLYTALAGSAAFARSPDDSILAIFNRIANQDPPPLPESVPHVLRDTVLKAMARDPKERYQSAAELAEALEAIGPLNEERVELLRREAALAELASEPFAKTTEIKPTSSKVPKIVGAVIAVGILVAAVLLLSNRADKTAVDTGATSPSSTVADNGSTGNPGDTDSASNTDSSGEPAPNQPADSEPTPTPRPLPSPTPTPSAGEKALRGIGKYATTAFLHSCRGVKQVPATLMPPAPGSFDGDGSLVFSAEYSTWWVELDASVTVYDEALINQHASVIQMDTASSVNLDPVPEPGDTLYIYGADAKPIEANVKGVFEHSSGEQSDSDLELELVDGGELHSAQAVANADGALVGYIARDEQGNFFLTRQLVSELNGELNFGECATRSDQDYDYLAKDWDDSALPDALRQLLLIQHLVDGYAQNDWDLVSEIEGTKPGDEVTQEWSQAEDSFVIARAKGVPNPRGTADWVIGVVTYDNVDGDDFTTFSCYAPKANTDKGVATLGERSVPPQLPLGEFSHLSSSQTQTPNRLAGRIGVDDLFLLAAYSCSAS